MKRTPLYDAHLRLGAKLVDFAGFEMPIQYTGIIDEHMTVRRKVGVFDVSHMGEIIIRGDGAGDLLRRLLTKDIEGLRAGRAAYGHLLRESGTIIDDTIVFKLDEKEFLMVPNAATRDTVREWIIAHSSGEDIIDVGDRISCLAVQGPNALELMRGICDTDPGAIRRFSGKMMDLETDASKAVGFLPDILGEKGGGNGTRAFISRTGYTGEDGFEIFLENASAMDVWNALMHHGPEHGLKPIGLGARDTLRLEMGYLLSGTDFDGTQTTLQTGPSFALDWDHDFIGRDALIIQREQNYERLVGFELTERGVPRHAYPIYGEEEIGRVTSGTMSPCLNSGIGMGYVTPDHDKVGARISIGIRGHRVGARIVRPPFIKRRSG